MTKNPDQANQSTTRENRIVAPQLTSAATMVDLLTEVLFYLKKNRDFAMDGDLKDEELDCSEYVATVTNAIGLISQGEKERVYALEMWDRTVGELQKCGDVISDLRAQLAAARESSERCAHIAAAINDSEIPLDPIKRLVMIYHECTKRGT